MQHWIKIISTPLPFKAEMVKSILDENGIYAVVINKADSSMLVYGEAGVYVAPEDEARALAVLAENNELSEN